MYYYKYYYYYLNTYLIDQTSENCVPGTCCSTTVVEGSKSYTKYFTFTSSTSCLDQEQNSINSKDDIFSQLITHKQNYIIFLFPLLICICAISLSVYYFQFKMRTGSSNLTIDSKKTFNEVKSVPPSSSSYSYQSLELDTDS